MYRFRWLFVTLTCVALMISATTAYAQTYLFQVEKMDVSVYGNPDGTASIEYIIQFNNSTSADPIDFVDIGVPNSSYSLSNVSADIDGTRISNITNSEYVSPGVALGLGSRAIPPGATGIVHVRIENVKNVYYPSTAEGVENYASLEFSPTWFGSEYVQGNTDFTMTLFLPVGINPEEPRYHSVRGGWPGASEPESGYDDEGRVYYRWTANQANAHTQYTFGASFPASLIPEESIVKSPPISFDFEDLCCCGTVLVILGSMGWGIYQAIWGARKRKLQYLPPKISIEGHGIKRGLTAVEAAILMEQPIDRVLTMILFSLIKKNGASVVTKEPLKVAPTKPQPEGLLAYEKGFLDAFSLEKESERKRELQTTIVNLVKDVGEKMKGFSRKESIAYYKDIIDRAWNQVATAETPEVKIKNFDQYMDWTMLDDKFDDKTRDVFRTGPVFVPTWWGRYDPTYSSSSSAGSFKGADAMPTASSGSGGGSFSLPSLPGAEFASSMVGGIQNFSNNIVGDLTSFTSGITNKTNPPPPPSRSSGRSGGGGSSCACACACAGCACACAGGGR